MIGGSFLPTPLDLGASNTTFLMMMHPFLLLMGQASKKYDANQ
jgi:hypothetical protein